ncbi:hypothetical protein [Thermotalea metallivorans]|uniref:Uncharacterized protein n=1 Tax=Thermotalea metallivorans TaxID=520762 RepID=A0A140L4F1_9FIRM|nr:hypothetical protein [Thermotalea metallivorans]KXG75426.1 hypothetical protein AN619_16900 [Thermotalea metallivorans]
MKFDSYNDQEMNHKIIEACMQDDEYAKDKLIEISEKDPRIPAMVFNHLYELIDYDLNFIIDVLQHSSERERNTILRDAQDVEGIRELFHEYDRKRLERLTIEDIVEGRDLDIIWEVKEGPREVELSRSYLTRCLLTIAYHLGFEQEIESFFEGEKRKYLVLH